MAENTEPMWALAAGCVPDAMPWDIPRIAHKAGFLSSGMWVEPETTWGSSALSQTRKSLADTGISLVDVEVVWLEGSNEANDGQKLVVDVGLELGAKNVLVVSRHENHEASIEQFRSLCERAGDGIRVCLEFGEFTRIKNLPEAQAFIKSVDHPAAGILIDLMHINRAGNALPDLDSSLYPYVQACDFFQDSAEMTGMDYILAAVDGRCCLGEGEARRSDIEQICRSDRDVSLEIRSKDLRETFPDPFVRGEEIFKRCVRGEFV